VSLLSLCGSPINQLSTARGAESSRQPDLLGEDGNRGPPAPAPWLGAGRWLACVDSSAVRRHSIRWADVLIETVPPRVHGPRSNWARQESTGAVFTLKPAKSGPLSVGDDRFKSPLAHQWRPQPDLGLCGIHGRSSVPRVAPGWHRLSSKALVPLASAELLTHLQELGGCRPAPAATRICGADRSIRTSVAMELDAHTYGERLSS